MSWLRRRMRSVSFRAGVVSGILVGLIMLAVALLVVGLVYGFLMLNTQSLQLAANERGFDQITQGASPDELDLGIIDFVDDSRSFWAVFVDGELVNSAGQYDEAVVSAPLLNDDRLVTLEVEPVSGLEQGSKKLDGFTWSYFSREFEHEGVVYTLITASDTRFTYGDFVRDSLWGIFAVVLASSLIAGLVTGLFSRLALGSVEKMRAEVQQISRESLDRRVPTTGAGDRVDKLANTMNEMLGRLEASSKQQSEFLAFASHELRSPVAGLVAQLDVAVAYPDRLDSDALLPKLQTEVERLQLLVDDLLYLSRSEALSAERPAPTPSSVDVGELLEQEARQLRDRYEDLTITVSGAAGVRLAGHERDLSRAIRNLAENAARHASSAVELRAAVAGAMVVVTVGDDGTGVPGEDAERIFERFVRLDEARTRDDGGSGLGLAIVREIARQHGGEVSVVADDGPGATFQLLLPVAGLPLVAGEVANT